MSASPRSDAAADSAERERIALISSSYAPAIGGVEETVRRLASGLRSQGHAVEVWTVDRAGSSSMASIDGITVRYLPAPLPASSPGAVARFSASAPRAWREWTRSFRSFQPTIAHVHCFGPNGLYTLALSRRHGTPLILTSHGETIADDGGAFCRSAILRFGLRRAVARAVEVTAPSGVVLEDLASNYGLRGGMVIPNGVDLSIAGTPPGDSEPYLFAVGRLGRMKGFDLLVEAFAAADLDSSVRLVIGGDGPERAQIEARVEELGIASRVELRGWMPPVAVADAMAGSSAVVVPSRMEAFGLVALEAWRSGAPLVMTRHGGAGGFMRDGEDAVLIDPEDTSAFAATLRRVLDDAALRRRLAAAGRVRVGDFGWDGVVAQYSRLYADVAHGDARAS